MTNIPNTEASLKNTFIKLSNKQFTTVAKDLKIAICPKNIELIRAVKAMPENYLRTKEINIRFRRKIELEKSLRVKINTSKSNLPQFNYYKVLVQSKFYLLNKEIPLFLFILFYPSPQLWEEKLKIT